MNDLQILCDAHKAGDERARHELVRRFSHLVSEAAKYLKVAGRKRKSVIAQMHVDLGKIVDSLRTCKAKPVAEEVEGRIRCELFYSLHHDREPFRILDSHHGKDRGCINQKRKCHVVRENGVESVTEAHDDPRYTHREGRIGRWRKLRDTPERKEAERRERSWQTAEQREFAEARRLAEIREQERHRAGYYMEYVRVADTALKKLKLSRPERVVMTLAAAGNSPEEIAAALPDSLQYVEAVITLVTRWVEAIPVPVLRCKRRYT
jgi:hypothetical protein